MNTAHVSSFVLISILRGQPRTPSSGDNLGVLDYHLKLPVHTKRNHFLSNTFYSKKKKEMDLIHAIFFIDFQPKIKSVKDPFAVQRPPIINHPVSGLTK